MELPLNHCPQDTKWITEQLEQLQHSLKSRVCGRYNDVYSGVYSNNDNTYLPHQVEGVARFEANTRLREFVEKYGNSSLGATLPPPKLE